MKAHELLAKAFHEDPFICWAEPDPRRRPRTMSSVFSGVLRYAQTRGGHLHEPDIGSVHWRAPEHVHMRPLAVLTSGTYSVAFVAPPAVWCRLSRHEDAAMRGVERWLTSETAYLCTLGVNPDRSRLGHGSRLLQAALREIGRSWSRCVLRTEQPRNLAFYRRSGFMQVDEFVVRESGLRAWVFARELAGAGV